MAQIERFVQESKAQGRQWKRIRLLGGEPTLHPEILDIIRILLDYRRDFMPSMVLVLTTNGFGDQVNEVLKAVPPEVVIENTHKKSTSNPFDTFNVAPVDLPEYRGVDYTNACHMTHMFAIALTRYGYYSCGAGAGIDRVTGRDIGRKTLPPMNDPMTEQLDVFCRLCGHFKHHVHSTHKELMSPSWQKIYANYHAVRPGLTLYGGLYEQ